MGIFSNIIQAKESRQTAAREIVTRGDLRRLKRDIDDGQKRKETTENENHHRD